MPPNNHSASQKTRLMIICYVLSMHAFDRQTDRQTDAYLIASPRCCLCTTSWIRFCRSQAAGELNVTLLFWQQTMKNVGLVENCALTLKCGDVWRQDVALTGGSVPATSRHDRCFRLKNIGVFTALHGMQMRSSDENSVSLSVRQSVCPSNA